MPQAIAIPAITAGGALLGSVGGAAIGSHSASNAADTTAAAEKYAADLQSKSAQQALAFEQQQAQQSQQNWQNTTAFNRGVYNDQQQRLAPYRALGAGSIAQLSQPIPKGGQ